MDRFVRSLQTLFGNPLPFIMAVVALVCAVAAANPRNRRVDRLLSAALAIVSCGGAWYMLRLLRLL